MATAASRLERAGATAIVAGAIVLAAWILWKPTAPPLAFKEPPPEEVAREVKPLPALAESLQIELVELPPDPASAEAASPPAPPSQPEVAAISAPPPAPVPVKLTAPTPPQKADPPKPVMPLRPDARAASKVEALRPDPPKAEPEPLPVEALKPEQHIAALPEPVPLRPDPPKPEPVKKVEPPKPQPKPKAEIKPPVESKPAPKTEPAPQANVAAVVGEGRAFLRILENGHGPSIEIGWPADGRQRERLYGVLVRCLGMRTAMLDGQSRLFIAEGARGQPTALNADQYSGFVRRPEGALAGEEQKEIARVRAYHATIAGAEPARIFPRRVDAYLIGGLRQAVGDEYLKKKVVRAAYRLDGDRAIVDQIFADGRRIPGVIDLSTVSNGCRGAI